MCRFISECNHLNFEFISIENNPILMKKEINKKLYLASLTVNFIFIFGLCVLIFINRQKIYERLFPRRQVDVVLFGDSLTFEGDWNNLLTSKSILNKGTSGTTSSELTKSMRRKVLIHHPKICFIQAGTNDIGLGIPIPRIIANFDTLLHTMQRHHIIPVIQLVVYNNNNPQKNLTIDTLNAGLKCLIENNAIDFIDLNDFLSENKLLKKECTYDGVHFNRTAYTLWSSKINLLLKKYRI